MNFFSRKNSLLLFLAAFFIWLLPFRGFLTGNACLANDAISYYDHTKFFIDQLLQGDFPLWDPTWLCGLPNEFFLRRINPYNPFLLPILVLRIFGLSQTIAYGLFLIFYFFLGTLGFYRCARILFPNKNTAFLSFLLLLFSPLGGWSFDSYVVLIFTPMIWFFYFLGNFYRKQKPTDLAGITFTLMLLFNVYLPFYFLLIFFFFILALLLTYPAIIRHFLARLILFTRMHPGLVFFCSGALVLSLLPGIIFFISAHQQEIILPLRHRLSVDPNTLTVDQKWITGWGPLEEILFGTYFRQYNDLTLTVFITPVFAFILLILGAVLTQLRKITLFIFLWILGLTLVSTPFAFPLYSFLYEHIFFFKYFKNLQFFLWLGILPLGCLFFADQWQQLIEFHPKNLLIRALGYLLLFIVHAGICGIYILQGNSHFSPYLTIFCSLCFFILIWEQIIRPGQRIFILFLFLIVSCQPLEVFSWMTRLLRTSPNQYDHPYPFTEFKRPDNLLLRIPSAPWEPPPVRAVLPVLYIATPGFNNLAENMDPGIINSYVRNKFIVYDRTALFPPGESSYEFLSKNFAKKENLAYVASEEFLSPDTEKRQFPEQAFAVEKNSPEFRLVEVTANSARLQTNFPQRKFLVFTDNFNSRWSARVNGKGRTITPANLAFKGIWLDPGPQDVVFRFGSTKDLLFNFFLMGLFNLMCFLIFGLRHVPVQKRQAIP